MLTIYFYLLFSTCSSSPVKLHSKRVNSTVFLQIREAPEESAAESGEAEGGGGGSEGGGGGEASADGGNYTRNE